MPGIIISSHIYFHLHFIANNLPYAFTGYKGVTKSLNLRSPSKPKRGRASQQEDASRKHPRTTRKNHSSNTVNASQPSVDRHRVDTIEHSQPSSQARAIDDAGRSEHPAPLVLGNTRSYQG